MDAFQNIGLKDYFKRYGIKFALKRGIFTACPFHIVKDYENKKILYYRKVQKWLKKKYLYAASVMPEGLQFGSADLDNPIWIYWKQGVENAPELVKKCINSVQKNAKQKVILLTEENSNEFIRFPAFILEKLNSGNISAAAFSDLLRFSLLEHYGGTWIDATVYLTGPLPHYITESELFAFRDSFGLIENHALIPNWLLHSKPNNKIMTAVRNMSFEYWKNEKHVVDYLFTYIILTIILEQNKEDMTAIPYVSSEYCRLLMNELGNQFDQEKFDHITSLSSVHKLSYKLKNDVVNKDGTVYRHLMNGR